MNLPNLLYLGQQGIAPAIKTVRTVESLPAYFLDFIGLIGSKYVNIRLRDGTRLKLHSGSVDSGRLNAVFILNQYLQEGNAIGENDVVVDIGAHIGLFTVLASKAAVKGRVYAFEPFSANFGLLKENVSLNRLDNVTPVNAAVSSRTGRLRFFLNNTATWHGIYPRGEKVSEISVESVSLADFLKSEKISRIDFLKMNCEGAEYEILLGCPSAILKKIRMMSVEYHPVPGHGQQEIRELLERNGFAVRVRPFGVGLGMLYAKRKC
jgi:FkbM family methyltransferase